ncbi:hypothetical protein KBF38_05855 [bacterium]|nr:hypothetical protein [bacterium]
MSEADGLENSCKWSLRQSCTLVGKFPRENAIKTQLNSERRIPAHCISLLMLSTTVNFALLNVSPCYSDNFSVSSTPYQDASKGVPNHPVLGIKPFTQAADTEPTSGTLKRMCGLLDKNKGHLPFFRSTFEYSEFELALRFSESITGSTMRQIEDLAGTPQYVEVCSLGKPGDSATDEQQWTYVFGVTPILIRLNFRGGVCSGATTKVYYEDRVYRARRISELEKSVIGKSVREIVANQGLPSDCDSRLSLSELSPSQARKFWETAQIVHEKLLYRFGRIIFGVTIDNNKCTKIENDFIVGKIRIPQAEFMSSGLK